MNEDEWAASVDAELTASGMWAAVIVLTPPAAEGLGGTIRTRLPGEFPSRDLAETIARARIAAEARER